jgi:alkaline phosphatase D
MADDSTRTGALGRRAFLQGAGALSIGLVAGCEGEAADPVGADAANTDAGLADADVADAAPNDAAPADAPTADAAPADAGRDELDDYTWDGPVGDASLFSHGVASGDPLPEAVILWTRVTVEDDAPVNVWWEISETPDFRRRVQVGELEARSERDHTVKLDVTGLESRRTYWYRFFAQGVESMHGQTRTPARGAIDAARIAFCSCSRYDNGWFHAYRDLAEQTDVDAVLHLGDYIYEYGANPDALRPFDPPNEIVSLDDYRRRYRQYHTDPDLQAARAAHPFVVVWDDHESTNNAFTDGAQNHQPSEGDWAARKQAAWQAYSEWMPIRDTDPLKIWRQLAIGDLVDIWMLDTRLWGRDAPEEAGGDVNDPNRQLLGADQEAWLFAGMQASTAAWKLLGQQVPMAINRASAFDFVGDKWGEYSAARDRLYDVIRDTPVADVIVLSGDIHCAWAIDLADDPYDAERYDGATGQGALAVELVTGGITQGAFSGAFAQSLGDAVVREEPPVQYANIGDKGYVMLDLTAERTVATWRFVSTVTEQEHERLLGARVTIERGSAHAVRDAAVPYGTAG